MANHNLRRGTIAGIPAIWAPRSGPTSAGLTFRVGQLDEALHQRGWTHLIEHLALRHLRSPAFAYNGFTGWTNTSFVMRGTIDEAAPFFVGVAQALGSLPMEHAAREAQVLDTEAAQRGAAATSEVLLNIYGAVGPGVFSYPEFGLRDVQHDELATWARRYFTRSNAHLWFAGPDEPQPFDLDLVDGDGCVAPVPAFAPIDRLPGWVNVNASFVSLSAEVADVPALGAARAVLERRLVDRLRDDEALSYAISSSQQSLGRGRSIAFVSADHRPGDGSKVFELMAKELELLATAGATADELDRWRQQVERFVNHEHDAADSIASRWAESVLRGDEPESAASLVHDAGRVTGEDVAMSVREIQSAAGWGVPRDATVTDGRVGHFARVASWRADGAMFVVAENDPQHVGEAIIVSDEGVSYAWSHDGASSVRFDQLAVAAVQGPENVWLVDRTGFSVEIDAKRWHQGEQLVDDVLRRCDPAKVRRRAVVADGVVEETSGGAKDTVRGVAGWRARRKQVAADKRRARSRFDVVVPLAAAARWCAPAAVPDGLVTVEIAVPPPTRKERNWSRLSSPSRPTAHCTAVVTRSEAVRVRCAPVSPLLMLLGIMFGFVALAAGASYLVPVAVAFFAFGVVIAFTNPVRFIRTGPAAATVRCRSQDIARRFSEDRTRSVWAARVPASAPGSFAPDAMLAPETERIYRELVAAAPGAIDELVVRELVLLPVDERVAVLRCAADTEPGRRRIRAMADGLGHSAIAMALRGWASIGDAWFVRGSGLGSTVSVAAAGAFNGHLRDAERCFAEAAKLDANDALCRIGLLVSGRGLTVPIDERVRRYDDAVRVAPASYQAAAQQVQSLAPKWGGSVQSLVAFADELLASHGPAHPVAGAALAAHSELALADQGGAVALRADDRAEVVKQLSTLVERDPSLTNLLALNAAAGAAYAMGERAVVKSALNILGDRLSAVPWGYHPDGPRPLRSTVAVARAVERQLPKVQRAMGIRNVRQLAPLLLVAAAIVNSVLSNR